MPFADDGCKIGKLIIHRTQNTYWSGKLDTSGVAAEQNEIIRQLAALFALDQRISCEYIYRDL